MLQVMVNMVLNYCGITIKSRV